MSEFTHREFLGRRVHRLGLSGNYGLDADGVRRAFELGLNYVLWTVTARQMVAPLREALGRDRERYVVATGPTMGVTAGGVRRAAEKVLKTLDTDYLDIFQLFWLGKTSAWTDGTVGELLKLKEEGKVRAIGVSIHDRPRAGQLAADSPLDMMMIRYNAAHTGAERDIFPHLSGGRPEIVAYTATAWQRLLKAPRGWQGKVPDAGRCYRFALSNPHVGVCLTGPADVAQLEANVAALEAGPMDSQELDWMRAFGEKVHASSGLVSRVGENF
jgi:aryl-alcohol dehydrogenase-like predicted oxidoreductase